MPANRFFSPGPLQGRVDLKDAEHHHLRVMRIAEGEEVELVNGQGQLARAKLVSMDKHKATLQVLSVQSVPRPTHSIALAIPYMRASKLEFIVEKGTELGADAFYLFPSERAEKCDLSPNQLERLHLLIVSALKQSGRLYLPSLEIVSHLEALFQKEALFLFGDLSATAPPLTSVEAAPAQLVFITGPEQGFSEREKALLMQKAQGRRLSPHILRAETAPIVAACLLNAFMRPLHKSV